MYNKNELFYCTLNYVFIQVLVLSHKVQENIYKYIELNSK